MIDFLTSEEGHSDVTSVLLVLVVVIVLLLLLFNFGFFRFRGSEPGIDIRINPGT